MKKQLGAFNNYEADSWYTRNLEGINAYDPNNDEVIKLMKEYGLKPNSVLEIGCVDGYRLNGIKEIFGTDKLYGVEPSPKAIENGRIKHPEIQFYQTTADDMSEIKDTEFDLIIVGFIFYILDRELLFKTNAQIDRLLKDKGYLLIKDFYTAQPKKNPYDHIKEFQAFTYKQPYDEAFTSSKIYHSLVRSTIDFGSKNPNVSEEFNDLISLSLLRKDISASYK